MHGQLNVRIVDDGQRNCPKHVEFYSKNKFEKFVHVVGFTIRIYHYARSHERQIRQNGFSPHCKFSSWTIQTWVQNQWNESETLFLDSFW